MQTPSPGSELTRGFARLGRLCSRWRWWVIGLWVVVLVAIGGFAPRLAGELTPGGFEIKGSTSEQARTLILERFSGDFPTSLTAVLTAEPGVADPEAALTRAAKELDSALSADPLVGDVANPIPGSDSRTTFVFVGIQAGLDDALKQADRLLGLARAASTDDVRIEVTGGPAIFDDFDRVNEEDLRRSELIQIPVVLLILLLVLGSLIAASLPIVATFTALVVTLGALYFVARGIDLSIYVQNIVPLVGIGVGVDYSLFLVKRFAEELRAGRPTVEAVAATMHTSGRAIFFSGLTVVVALAGMFAVGVPIFTGFALGSIAVVAVAMATGLTLVPAVLAALGPRVGKWNVGARLRPPSFRDAADDKRWVRWAEAVMRRPWPYLLGSSAALLALAVPALWLDLGSSGATALPRDVPSIRAADALSRDLGPGALAPLRIVVDGGTTAPSSAGVESLVGALRRDPAVTRIGGVRPSDDGSAQLFQVIPAFGEDTVEAQRLVERIEDEIVPATTALGDARVLIGGAASQNRDFNETVAKNLPRVIGLVMLLTFLVLVVLFRSILLPLKAVVMTLLSVVAAYGVLVVVFQWGVGDSLLGFDHLGHVTAWVPPFLFSILFGLSMDYEVFLLARVREHYDLYGDDRAAVAWGLARSGGIITAAAAIMIVVFLSFLLNRLIPIKESSLGLAVAVFLDATIVRIILVPAFMRIAGKWNWWLPRWLDRLLPAPHHS